VRERESERMMYGVISCDVRIEFGEINENSKCSEDDWG
jgi:hypothetical protein